MTTKRKILMLGRHGVAPQSSDGSGSLDALTAETIPNLYTNGHIALRPFIGQNRILPQGTFVRHSDKKRTMLTAQAILAGAWNFQPILKSEEEVMQHTFPGVDIKVSPELCYTNFALNDEAVKKYGTTGYTNKWMANPDADTLDGVKITPFNEIMRRQRKFLAREVAGGMLMGGKDLGIVVSHCPIIDQTAMALVNSARDKPAYDFDAIGGPFGMEQYALLVMEGNPATGNYKAKMVRDGKEYPVNMGLVRED